MCMLCVAVDVVFFLGPWCEDEEGSVRSSLPLGAPQGTRDVQHDYAKDTEVHQCTMLRTSYAFCFRPLLLDEGVGEGTLSDVCGLLFFAWMRVDFRIGVRTVGLGSALRLNAAFSPKTSSSRGVPALVELASDAAEFSTMVRDAEVSDSASESARPCRHRPWGRLGVGDNESDELLGDELGTDVSGDDEKSVCSGVRYCPNAALADASTSTTTTSSSLADAWRCDGGVMRMVGGVVGVSAAAFAAPRVLLLVRRAAGAPRVGAVPALAVFFPFAFAFAAPAAFFVEAPAAAPRFWRFGAGSSTTSTPSSSSSTGAARLPFAFFAPDATRADARVATAPRFFLLAAAAGT
ncbi:hypothetical protein C8Q77DRAFT_811090 [Trametes polyzona]|nr:hypothetical protein C8Q77DRAFT_811090 [Trametes polyzona]